MSHNVNEHIEPVTTFLLVVDIVVDRTRRHAERRLDEVDDAVHHRHVGHGDSGHHRSVEVAQTARGRLDENWGRKRIVYV